MDLSNSQLDIGLITIKISMKKLNFRNVYKYINLNMLKYLKLSNKVYLYYNW